MQYQTNISTNHTVSSGAFMMANLTAGDDSINQAPAILHALAGKTTDAILVISCNGRVIFANPVAAELHGKSVESIIGCFNHDLYLRPVDAEMIDAIDREVLLSGAPLTIEESIGFPGGLRTFRSIREPLQNPAGQPLGLICIRTDITEQKRTEEDPKREQEPSPGQEAAAHIIELQKQLGRLEAVYEEEKRMLARELHDDLGSTLTALNMHLAILFRQIPENGKLADRREQINTLLNSVTQTVRHVQRRLCSDKLDVFGVKFAVAEQARSFAQSTSIACHVDLPDEELTYPRHISIALLRMVQDALDRVSEGATATRVDVVIDDTDEDVVLSVRDNGMHIDTSKPLFNACPALQKVQYRATYLGGEMRMMSTPGMGTDVIVVLPKHSRPGKPV